MADISIAFPNNPLEQGQIEDLQLLDKGSLDPEVIVPKASAKLREIAALNYLDELPKYYFRLQIGTYNRQNLNVKGSFDTELTMNLPLPKDLSDTQLVVFDQTPLNPILGNALNVGYNASVSAQGEAATKNVKDNVMNSIGGGAIAATTLLPGGAGFIANTGLGLAGYSPNQFLTILLRGPQYKQYSFEWDLAPKSVNETISLCTMLTSLKNASAPGYAGGGAFFRFPKIFKLALMPNSGLMYKFKPSVMTRIIVDYAGGGAPAFRRSMSTKSNGEDNAPAIYRLHLTFTELEFWLNGNYNLSTDPDDVYDRIETSTGDLRRQIERSVSNAVDLARRAGLDSEGFLLSLQPPHSLFNVPE